MRPIHGASKFNVKLLRQSNQVKHAVQHDFREAGHLCWQPVQSYIGSIMQAMLCTADLLNGPPGQTLSIFIK